MPIPKRAILSSLAGVGLVLVILLMAGTRDEPVTYHGTHLSPGMSAAPFTLASAESPVSLEDFAGKAVVLFFGFTSCPDVCPTTLHRLSSALEQLGDAREDVQVVFVSVDPERDSPERVASYARAVDPSFLGLTGTEEEIAEVAAQYGIYHARAEGGDATGYMVDHTTTVLVLNEHGRLELLWSSTVTAPEMAEDLAALLRG